MHNSYTSNHLFSYDYIYIHKYTYKTLIHTHTTHTDPDWYIDMYIIHKFTQIQDYTGILQFKKTDWRSLMQTIMIKL